MPTKSSCPLLITALTFLLNAVLVSAAPEQLEFSGYAEILYSMYNYGPDQKSSPNGSPSDYRADIDLLRVSGEVEYHFKPTLFFVVEVEIEHGGAGLARELEYEEFGEYETEIERGGEVVIEELRITKSFSDQFNLTVGHILVPVGLINKRHFPSRFFTANRPEGETTILPSLWHENGIEAAGSYKAFSYIGQIVNGLDATGFSSKHWIAGGHQTQFEKAKATDLAVAARLDCKAMPGLTVGASAYYGNSTRNRPKNDMDGISGHVALADIHATFDRSSWLARGLLLSGSLENADIISAKNARLSTAGGFPRTPVAKNALIWSVEAGRDIAHFFDTSPSFQLYPFLRAEYYNSMEDTDPGIFASPRFERNILTGGLNLFYDNYVTVKADCSVRSFGSSTYRAETTYRLSVGFQSLPITR